jgi:hypothetical protein
MCGLFMSWAWALWGGPESGPAPSQSQYIPRPGGLGEPPVSGLTESSVDVWRYTRGLCHVPCGICWFVDHKVVVYIGWPP